MPGEATRPLVAQDLPRAAWGRPSRGRTPIRRRASIRARQPPLVDYAVKGTKVELAGVEPVEGHAAYKLKLTMKNGETQTIWIDAQSFLDVKVEGTPRRMDGKMHKVFVIQRDFRPVQGLKIPFVCETAVEGYPQTHALTLKTVVVNPTLDDARFTKAQMLAAGMPPAATPVAVNK